MPPPKNKIPPPKGTRDMYPLEAARRRWLSERWRKVAIRHGFEEVDGPTFETTDLYAVKSGEGILGELFQSFSGKDPKDIERIRAGEAAPFAMRPEFTPSLARMYAERARSLPSPCKWFQIGPFFRAERPQRGRLREFLQWNVDVLGLDIPAEKWNAEDAEGRAEVAEAKARMDAEIIHCVIDFLQACGFDEASLKVRVSDRELVADLISKSMAAVDPTLLQQVFELLDKRTKLSSDKFLMDAQQIGFDVEAFDGAVSQVQADSSSTPLRVLRELSVHSAFNSWVAFDPTIVRGLAYYTGTVFEVIADGERAVAGGGRYDNLIELFGGQPTPAVGFAMGDVVISLLLQDKGLMPSDAELMQEIGARPDVFVIAPSDDLDPIAIRLLATLRREGLHARRSYKTTRNVGKLLKEASQQHARLAIIIESADQATIRNLDAADQQSVQLTSDDAPFDMLLEAAGELLRA